MTSAHQISGVAGVCSKMMDVFHAQRVCPVGNPCGWPHCVPPQRRACVYDAVFFGRNGCRINVLLSPCVRGAKVWVDFAFIRNVPKSIFKKRRNSVSVVPVGGVCCTRLPTLLPLLPFV